ncbi:pyrroline-5-carboxylate reductase [Rhodoligotrophos appendicifer]|uniref:pyrroline-5-carboxylate reductase n=1 Tax=Rhodoligotrophos appendicifer TaxID=987056 RepID=UPI001186487E|nr:pyrroline-5-carboxylate reductase [Rhodoligotrophos appendicifer]
MNFDGKLVLVGAGKMGGAMLEGWLSRGLTAGQVVVIDPSPAPEITDLINRQGVTLNPVIDAIDDVAVVLIAVKPQAIGEVLPTLAPLAKQKPLFISVAAGKTLATFEAAFGDDKAIIRAMPNTPAAVGRGITVLCPNQNVTHAQLALGEDLLSAVGEVDHITEESLMDAVTAVSGSGPAYVFFLAECLSAAGIKAGLPEGLATKLARETVAGAGELMRVSGLPAAVLRENVTSAGGTTAAALAVLMSADGLRPIMQSAVAAATRRSRELAV